MSVGVTVDRLAQVYPHLYHMAEAGSWASIKQYGLLSTTALLDLYGITGKDRHRLESCRRANCEILEAANLPGATIRDNIPMSDSRLRDCLVDGLKPSDWYRILNGKVFFWLSEARLKKLLNARAYRKRSHTIFSVDTKRLCDAHGKNIKLSPINSGCTAWAPPDRGLTTFLPLAQYPFETRLKEKGKAWAAIELTVEYSIPDFSKYVLTVSNRAAVIH